MSDIIRISNINNYKLELVNNQLILTPIQISNYITENDLLSKNLRHSHINHCIIKDKDDNIILNNSNGISYIKNLIDLYKNITTSIILQNTTFNISVREDYGGNKGYVWYPEIRLSIQSRDAHGTLREIIHMIRINEYKIDIEINLSNGEIINYKNF
jgi:hypothetical protein